MDAYSRLCNLKIRGECFSGYTTKVLQQQLKEDVRSKTPGFVPYIAERDSVGRIVKSVRSRSTPKLKLLRPVTQSEQRIKISPKHRGRNPFHNSPGPGTYEIPPQAFTRSFSNATMRPTAKPQASSAREQSAPAKNQASYTQEKPPFKQSQSHKRPLRRRRFQQFSYRRRQKNEPDYGLEDEPEKIIKKLNFTPLKKRADEALFDVYIFARRFVE